MTALLLLGSALAQDLDASKYYRPTLDWLTGDWVGADEQGWTFQLSVDDSGGFQRTVLRGGGGSCLQEGELRLDGRELVLHYSANSCNSDFVDKTDRERLVGLGPDSLGTDSLGHRVAYARDFSPTEEWLRRSWRGSDPDGWAYQLEVGEERFTQRVDRGDKGVCKQSGSIELLEEGLRYTYAVNECNPDYVGLTDLIHFAAVGPERFVLDRGSYRIEYLPTK